MIEAGAVSVPLQRSYLCVLVPPALVAPLPLFWTNGASPMAIVLYEAALLLLWWRAKRGRPVRLSDAVLNTVGLSYFLWLGFEISILRVGLLRCVSHLLLFTAVAKMASLKRPGEARTALLVLFLLTLAAASSSTHASSLLYFAAMAVLAFHALGRLSVLADFDQAPPDRVLASIPTRGVAAASIIAAALMAAPLFYALPRLRRPFAFVPLRAEEALSSALVADRVELESFGAAKRSNRVVLRMDVEPQAALSRVLRLREAVFTDYRDGVWRRRPYTLGGSALRGGRGDYALPEARRGRPVAGKVSINLNLFTNGFLFLPYGAVGLELDRGSPVVLPDGVVQLASNQRSIQYTVGVRIVESRGMGSSVIDPRSVPREIREYAEKLTGDLSEPPAIYQRIRDHFVKEFVYTLDPPVARGDPLVAFLLRSKAGHCEFFASAAAMMLTARGIPARLVTGSYGGELSFLSRALVVRGENLHSWVEAEIDGTGFSVLDPTPEAGIPPATTRVSWWKRLQTFGREIEFFYDRRILGFDSLDQVRIIEAARESLASAAQSLTGWKSWLENRRREFSGLAVGLAAIAALLLLATRRFQRRAATPEATRAYLALRRLVARRQGFLSPAIPPAEVARLFGEAVPSCSDDAQIVVRIYCASIFGGRQLDRATSRDLTVRLRRLKKLA